MFSLTTLNQELGSCPASGLSWAVTRCWLGVPSSKDRGSCTQWAHRCWCQPVGPSYRGLYRAAGASLHCVTRDPRDQGWGCSVPASEGTHHPSRWVPQATWVSLTRSGRGQGPLRHLGGWLFHTLLSCSYWRPLILNLSLKSSNNIQISISLVK